MYTFVTATSYGGGRPAACCCAMLSSAAANSARFTRIGSFPVLLKSSESSEDEYGGTEGVAALGMVRGGERRWRWLRWTKTGARAGALVF